MWTLIVKSYCENFRWIFKKLPSTIDKKEAINEKKWERITYEFMEVKILKIMGTE